MANLINIGGGAGGGSSVEPNPQGTATDTLVKLGIEGTIYDFAGGGSGGIIDVLYSGTAGTTGSVSLTGDYTDYDLLVFKCYNTNMGGYFGSSFSTESLAVNDNIMVGYGSLPNTNRRLIGAFSALNAFDILTVEDGTQLTEIVGYKFGGGSGHNYSTTEQAVGKWIDGSTVYEKTILVQNVTLANNTTTDITISDYISDLAQPISLTSLCNAGQSGGWLTLPYYVGSLYTIQAFFNDITTISVFRNGGAITVDLCFIIRYTKAST